MLEIDVYHFLFPSLETSQLTVPGPSHCFFSDLCGLTYIAFINIRKKSTENVVLGQKDLYTSTWTVKIKYIRECVPFVLQKQKCSICQSDVIQSLQCEKKKADTMSIKVVVKTPHDQRVLVYIGGRCPKSSGTIQSFI